MIDKKSKIFFTIIILIIIASLAMTYYRAIVLKDFERISSEEDVI